MDEQRKNQGEMTAKELTGRERRLANLKPPINKRSPEEQHEIAVKGGIARGEQQKQQKTMRETMLALLNTKVSNETASKYLGADAERLTENDLTCQNLLSAKMWQEAMKNGNAKAAEFVRDTSGQRPKDVVEVTANMMTDADRALMANMAEILSAKADKTE